MWPPAVSFPAHGTGGRIAAPACGPARDDGLLSYVGGYQPPVVPVHSAP